MQAITTRMHAPTDTMPARIIATASAGRYTWAYDHSLEAYANHVLAARALAGKLGWITDAHGKLATGALHTGDYAHVFHN